MRSVRGGAEGGRSYKISASVDEVDGNVKYSVMVDTDDRLVGAVLAALCLSNVGSLSKRWILLPW